MLRRRRIARGILLVPLLIVVLFFGSAAIVGMYEGRSQRERQLPQSPVSPLPKASNVTKAGQMPVRAFAFKSDYGSGRGLFLDVREKLLSLNGQQIRVLCPADGTGEVIAEVNGEYVAVNSTARSWASTKEFWVVRDKELVPVFDFGYPNNVPKRFEVLEPNVTPIIKTGVEMCPLASPAVATAAKAIHSAVESYATNARSLGISIP